MAWRASCAYHERQFRRAHRGDVGCRWDLVRKNDCCEGAVGRHACHATIALDPRITTLIKAQNEVCQFPDRHIRLVNILLRLEVPSGTAARECDLLGGGTLRAPFRSSERHCLECMSLKSRAHRRPSPVRSRSLRLSIEWLSNTAPRSVWYMAWMYAVM